MENDNEVRQETKVEKETKVENETNVENETKVENDIQRKEISVKEVKELDKSRVKSITLKDGKVILITSSQSSDK